MTVEISLYLRNQSGFALVPVRRFTSLSWALSENEFGKLNATGPLNEIDTSMFELDARFELYRAVDGQLPYLEGVFLLRYWRFYRDSAGAEWWEIEAYTPEFILDSRIVDYNASTTDTPNAYTEKTDYADDMLKAIVAENLGASATVAARQISLVAIDPDLSAAPSISKAFARRNVYDLCKEIADNALGDGTYLAFGVVATPDNSTMTFRTWTGQRGIDRTETSGNALIVSVDNGNLTEPSISFDHRTERTFVRAGGQGEGAQRATGTAEDTEREAQSYFNRRELFVDGRQTANTTILAKDAAAALEANRPIRGFSGKLLDTPSTRYGQDFGFGDLVTAQYLGYTFNCRIYQVRGAYSQSGESLDIDLRSETFA